MIWFFIILIFILVVASTWWFGLWSNFITFTNLLLASMIATSFFETAASKLLSMMPSYRLLVEFIAIWLVFVVAFLVLRTATDMLSSIRLKFDFLTETIGRSLLSVAIAFIFICFTCFTLQMAPLPPHLIKSETGLGPDNVWVAMTNVMSNGALSEARGKGAFFRSDTRKGYEFNDKRIFDPLKKRVNDGHYFRKEVSTKEKLRTR